MKSVNSRNATVVVNKCLRIGRAHPSATLVAGPPAKHQLCAIPAALAVFLNKLFTIGSAPKIF